MMKNIFLFIIILTTAIFSQQKSIYLNALDFSRFPTVDLYASIEYATSKDTLTSQKLSNSLNFIKINGKKVRVNDVKSVLKLKELGESELLISMIFDNSYSMEGRTELLEEAAELFIKGLLPGDYVTISDFGKSDLNKNQMKEVPETKEKLHVFEKIGFSNSKNYLVPRIKINHLNSKTYLYDSILYALSLLNSNQALGKKIIIVFSDGKDIGSSVPFSIVKTKAHLYNIPIFSIDLGKSKNRDLMKLSEVSKGEYYHTKKVSDLKNLYSTILKKLNTEYRISFTADQSYINANSFNIGIDLKEEFGLNGKNSFIIKGEQIGLANLLYLQSQGEDKVSDYFSYLSAFPNAREYEKVELNLGNHWFNLGEFPKALGVYNKLLRNKNSTQYFTALAQKGEALAKMEKFDKSRKVYEEILNSNASSNIKPQVLFNLASSYKAEGNYISALETYSTLSSNYEGTEWASESLLQSSIINANMGNLDEAVKNLNKVINDYKDSKSSEFAKFELSKIQTKQNKTKEAIRLLEDLTGSKKNADLVEKSKTNLLELYFQDKNFDKASTLINQINTIQLNDEEKGIYNKTKIGIYLNKGENVQAKDFFSSLPIEEKNELIKQPPVQFFVNSEPTVALLNSASISPGENIKLHISENKDLLEKYSTLGPIYSINNVSPNSIFRLPIDNVWKDQLKNNESAGVYLAKEKSVKKIKNIDENLGDFIEVRLNQSGELMLLTEDPIFFQLFNISFDFGKATIKKDAEKNLYKLLDYLKFRPNVKMEISGHTDDIGTDERNLILSLDRARAIKEFMVSKGIKKDRLLINGFGSEFPLVENSSEENRQLNRRTEFTVLQGSKNIIKEKKANKSKYYLSIMTSSSLKEIIKNKKYINKKGFQSKIKNIDNGYELFLGYYISESDCKKISDEFALIFKQFNLKIKSN